MIEILEEDNYDFEEGTSFPVYLPCCAASEADSRKVAIKGGYLGDLFDEEDEYPFNVSSVRIVPALPLNQVIGIPSLEGKIFEED